MPNYFKRNEIAHELRGETRQQKSEDWSTFLRLKKKEAKTLTERSTIAHLKRMYGWY